MSNPEEEKKKLTKEQVRVIQLMIIIPILVIYFLITNMQPSLSNRSPNSGIAVTDLVDHANDVATENVQKVKRTLTEEFNWQYSEPSLYFEDFSDIEAQLDEKSNEMIEAFFKERADFPLFFKTKNQYYLPVLKEIREGKISVEAALADPSRSIRVPTHDMYFWFPEDKDYNYIYEDIIDVYLKKLENEGMPHYMFQFYDIYKPLMSTKEIENLKAMEDPAEYLKKQNMRGSLRYRSDLMSSRDYFKEVDEIKNILEKKYNQEFMKVDFEYSFTEGLSRYYAPVTDPTLKFNAYDFQNKYLTLLTQRAMYEEIEKIIIEEGYEGHVAPLIIPNQDGLDRSPDGKSYDMSQNPDNLKIINEVYDGGYDISLFVLIENEDEIDYAKLQKISARTNDLLRTNILEDEEPWQRSDLFIFFYTLPVEEHLIVTDLFKRDMLTENYFRESTSFADIYANMYIVREETEGMHYLDIRAKKLDFLLRVMGDYEELMSRTVDEFQTYNRMTTLFK